MASGADLESANPLVTIHPLSRQMQRYALFVTLLRYDSSLTPQPYYASRWEWNADHRTLTLSLHGDLTWHDGAKTTARDAAFTFNSAKVATIGYPRAAELAQFDSVVAVNDTTLRLSFSAPQPRVPALLAELPLVPEHLLAKVAPRDMRTAAFNDAPIGNGPFKFASRQRGARWTFTRNDNFPASLGGPPKLAGFVIAVVDEATTKFAGLASGELDVAGISPTMASLAEHDATLRLVTYPVFFGSTICFNTTRPPFDDARVRLAVSRSIQRERIVQVALAGYASAGSSAISPDNPLSWQPRASLDTMRADSLLDAAGWRRSADGRRSKDGKPFAVELLTVGSGDNVAEQLVQSDLAARGISVTVRQTEMGAFLSAARAQRRTFDLLVAGIPGDLSFSYLSAMFSTTQAGGTLDFTGFHDAALDNLLAKAAVAGEGRERLDAWRAVQMSIDSLAPATWLYHSRGIQGITRRIHGVTMDLRGELVTLHDWYFERPGDHS